MALARAAVLSPFMPGIFYRIWRGLPYQKPQAAAPEEWDSVNSLSRKWRHWKTSCTILRL